MIEPDFVFPPASRTWVPVAGSTAAFPVRRVYCVGRNYAAHIREMGGDEREPPFFFQKPADAIVADGSAIAYPPITADFQHEIELVLAIGHGGADIAVADAPTHVFGLAVGVDLTRRDVQIAAREAGRPWEIGKAFDRSAPISAIHPLSGALPATGTIMLAVNGEVKQHADLAEMIWRPAEIVAELSRHYRLEAGDLIFTGTPAGVGPLVAGDVVAGAVEGVDTISFSITA